ARHLRPDGSFVVEAFVPGPEPTDTTGHVTPSVIEAGRVVLQVTRRHPLTQTVEGSVVCISAEGIRLRPWSIRYTSPDERDSMAGAAGLTLAQRWSGWRGQAFDRDSSHHVSVYQKG
ncbi:MAG: SAM-dependent methyltransferase, partial [Iamia sp.]